MYILTVYTACVCLKKKFEPALENSYRGTAPEILLANNNNNNTLHKFNIICYTRMCLITFRAFGTAAIYRMIC